MHATISMSPERMSTKYAVHPVPNHNERAMSSAPKIATTNTAHAVEAPVVPSPMKPSREVRIATRVRPAAMLAYNGPVATVIPAFAAAGSATASATSKATRAPR